MQNTENKFKHDGLWYIAVEQDGCRNCDFCAINTGCVLDQTFCTVPACNKGDRKDNRNVIFVRSDVDNLGGEE